MLLGILVYSLVINASITTGVTCRLLERLVYLERKNGVAFNVSESFLAVLTVMRPSNMYRKRFEYFEVHQLSLQSLIPHYLHAAHQGKHALSLM